MANPALTQASFDKVAERLFYALCKYMTVRETRYRFSRSTVRIQEENDTASSTSAWDLSGVKIGEDTDADGVIFVRVTDETPVGGATVDLYKATGGAAGDKVATGNAANGATITLAASNSSGVTGTVKLGTVGASETDDKHRLRCYVDFPTRDIHVFNGDETDDATLRSEALESNKRIVDLLQAAETDAAGFVGFVLVEYVAEKINAGSAIPLAKAFKNDDGAITLQVQGILEELRDAMEDNTTVQKIIKNTITVAAATFDASNTGKGTMTITALEKMLPGTVVMRCVDETIGKEKFRVSLRRSDNGELVTASNFLQVKKDFKDASLGVNSALLSRTFAKTNDATDVILAIASDASWSTSGESKSNTNGGVLYVSVVVNGANFNIEFYKASSRQSADLVAKATSISGNATTFQATESNRSGLTVNGKTGSAFAVATTIEFKLQPFKSGPPADLITVAITRTATGEIQTLLAELGEQALDWYLNSAASGSETLKDGLLLRGGPSIYGRN